MNRFERAKQYAEYFHNRGIPATPTLSGDTRVFIGSREYILTFNDADDGYFRFTRQFWQMSTEQEYQHAQNAAAAIPRTVPAAQILIDSWKAYAIAQTTWPGHLDRKNFHWKYFRAIETAIQHFVAKMQEYMERPPVHRFPLTKRARAQAYCSFLASMKYSASVTELDETEFTYENRSYTIMPDDNNDHELIISTTKPLAKITDDADHARVAAIAEKITRIAPRVMLWPDLDHSVYAFVHIYARDPIHIGMEFYDVFPYLQIAADKFAAEWAAAQTAAA